MFVQDASNISAGDLENIIETETPPQSPPALETGAFIIADFNKQRSYNGSTKSSDRRRLVKEQSQIQLEISLRQREVTGNLNSPCLSQPSSPVSFGSKASSPPPFPLPPPPSFDIFPLRSVTKEVPCEAVDKPPSVSTHTFIQRQQDQVGRIAEYHKRDSLVLTDCKVNITFILLLCNNNQRIVVCTARVK